ncbi:hypothetical protein PROFUN_07458 [Planoprotostelium fungivorum]|uniref:Uncharacterized protein n=1 Tax=Planoprotostelium fungivorum TaxID=1890364 RepID=A0A2P6NLG7_9EUKA|nr:hypothetical protein PROFUN_07458 [Planoprotostelium fungivorum]
MKPSLVLLLFFVSHTVADQCIWGCQDISFSNVLCWSCNHTPSFNDQVFIRTGGIVHIEASDNVTLSQVSISNGSSLVIAGSLTFRSIRLTDANLTSLNGSFLVGNGSSIIKALRSSLDIYGSGTSKFGLSYANTSLILRGTSCEIQPLPLHNITLTGDGTNQVDLSLLGITLNGHITLSQGRFTFNHSVTSQGRLFISDGASLSTPILSINGTLFTDETSTLEIIHLSFSSHRNDSHIGGTLIYRSSAPDVEPVVPSFNADHRLNHIVIEDGRHLTSHPSEYDSSDTIDTLQVGRSSISTYFRVHRFTCDGCTFDEPDNDTSTTFYLTGPTLLKNLTVSHSTPIHSTGDVLILGTLRTGTYDSKSHRKLTHPADPFTEWFVDANTTLRAGIAASEKAAGKFRFTNLTVITDDIDRQWFSRSLRSNLLYLDWPVSHPVDIQNSVVYADKLIIVGVSARNPRNVTVFRNIGRFSVRGGSAGVVDGCPQAYSLKFFTQENLNGNDGVVEVSYDLVEAISTQDYTSVRTSTYEEGYVITSDAEICGYAPESMEIVVDNSSTILGPAIGTRVNRTGICSRPNLSVRVVYNINNTLAYTRSKMVDVDPVGRWYPDLSSFYNVKSDENSSYVTWDPTSSFCSETPRDIQIGSARLNFTTGLYPVQFDAPVCRSTTLNVTLTYSNGDTSHPSPLYLTTPGYQLDYTLRIDNDSDISHLDILEGNVTTACQCGSPLWKVAVSLSNLKTARLLPLDSPQKITRGRMVYYSLVCRIDQFQFYSTTKNCTTTPLRVFPSSSSSIDSVTATDAGRKEVDLSKGDGKWVLLGLGCTLLLILVGITVTYYQRVSYLRKYEEKMKLLDQQDEGLLN